ncbi:MAG: hypothetical protein ACJLTB_21600 [Algoriphagus aquaeductus]|nr:hypothetical protein [Algoriphagus sp.]
MVKALVFKNAVGMADIEFKKHDLMNDVGLDIARPDGTLLDSIVKL